MSARILIAAQLAITLSLSGCILSGGNSGLQMTYSSDPMGAAIYEGERFLGYSPVTVAYAWQKLDEDGCMKVPPVRVLWASGAEIGFDSIRGCALMGPQQGRLFMRPKDVPGRDLDMQFSIGLQQTASQQAAAAAQERAAIFSALALQNAAAFQSYKTTHCSSRETNGSIHTVCY